MIKSDDSEKLANGLKLYTLESSNRLFKGKELVDNPSMSRYHLINLRHSRKRGDILTARCYC